ncbi:MAG: right-handed parallel beta-helix repeat-containing protein [Kiritimatiellia bacterium]
MRFWTSMLMIGGIAARSAEYHVATTGSDAGPGTASAPWKTIQKAADTLSPGDVVRVHEGVYGEAVTVRVSGSEAGGFVVFSAATGEHPVLDGTALVPPSNQNTGLFLLDGRSHVRIEGFELRNYAAVSGKKVPAGIHVRGASHHVELVGNNIHDIAYHSAGHGAFGIVVYGNTTSTIHHVVIDGNEVHHLRTGYSESISINGNVSDFRVTRNRVHDNTNIGIDLAGFYGAAPLPELDQARNGVCASNEVWNIDTSANPAYGATDPDGDGVFSGGENAAGGIYCDGSRDLVVEGNHLHHNDIGLELGSESSGGSVTGVVVRDNFVYQNRIGGLYLGGFALRPKPDRTPPDFAQHVLQQRHHGDRQRGSAVQFQRLHQHNHRKHHERRSAKPARELPPHRQHRKRVRLQPLLFGRGVGRQPLAMG